MIQFQSLISSVCEGLSHHFLHTHYLQWTKLLKLKWIPQQCTCLCLEQIILHRESKFTERCTKNLLRRSPCCRDWSARSTRVRQRCFRPRLMWKSNSRNTWLCGTRWESSLVSFLSFSSQHTQWDVVQALSAIVSWGWRRLWQMLFLLKTTCVKLWPSSTQIWPQFLQTESFGHRPKTKSLFSCHKDAQGFLTKPAQMQNVSRNHCKSLSPTNEPFSFHFQQMWLAQGYLCRRLEF